MSLFKSEIIVTPKIIGVGDGTAASAGQVGEHPATLVAVGSPVSLTTATAANVITLSLTPGDWMVGGNVNFTAAGATTAAGASFLGGATTTSATIPVDGSECIEYIGAITTGTYLAGIPIPMKRVSLTTTSNVYMVAKATFSAGTIGAYGRFVAWRVR
jgi:hypothetical protein